MKTEFRFHSNHPILAHHQVMGRGMLPGLAYIDLCYQWFRERGYACSELELRHVTIYRPATIRENEEMLLELHCAEMQPGHWQIRVDEGGSRTDEGISAPFMTAEMYSCPPIGFESSIDADRIRTSARTSTDMEAVYEHCRTHGLVHSGFMQTAGRLFDDADSILLDLTVAGDHLGEADFFLFHPALLDGSCVGAGALFTVMAEDQQLFLPVCYEAFRASEPIQSGCIARMKRSSVQVQGEVVSLTLEYFNSEGRKIGELENFAMKLVRDVEAVNTEKASAPSLPRDSSLPASADAMEALRPAVAGARLFLRQLIAERVNREEKDIHIRAGYYEMGLDSANLLAVAKAVETRIGTPVAPTLLFEYATIVQLAEYLASAYPESFASAQKESEERYAVEQDSGMRSAAADKAASAAPSASVPVRSGDIAVIGMAGRYPEAADLEAFWTNLKAGKDCIREVPASRWSSERLETLRSPSGKKMSRWGGFIDGPDCFDPQFFRITPREAETLDPQERLFLETCWATIEDAGYTPGTLAAPAGPHKRRRIGVFAGVMHKDYALLGAEAAAQGHPFPVSLNNAPIANRVSYFCNFHGPSIAVDTVCSSSLTAVHLAMESIRSGECEAALAGGVNLSLHPAKYATYGLMDMQSSDGRCRTFGSGGDGYVSGEGVGAVLLKPLDKAIEDGDHIYAVLKGSMINHGGTASGITVPSPVAQADLIGECFEKAGIDARSVSYIEAHGTGTPLGDPIEMDGLVKAFRAHTNDVQFCSIGSVKSNIGHAESAAGICGLQKVILQLHHGMLVPSLHAEQLNPHIGFEQSPFYVQKRLEPWQRPIVAVDGKETTLPRRAGISSFGATGSNAHLLLEEYIPASVRENRTPDPSVDSDGCSVLVPLSAKNKDRLQAYAVRLANYLQSAQAAREVDLNSLAYTLQIGREAMEERAVFLVRNVQELLAGLEKLAGGDEELGCGWSGRAPSNGDSIRQETAAEAESLESAARAWLQGQEIDWKGLYRGSMPQRMSLPAYPFARERYWVPATGDQASMPAAAAVIHPLLHQNVSDFREQRFRSSFTGRESFLADHLVNGQRMLPGTAYIEMARAAVALSAGELPGGQQGIRLKHLVWSNPLVVGEGSESVYISLFPETDHEISYEIYSSAPGGEPVVYSQGSAVLTAGTEEVPSLDLDRLRTECSDSSISADALYAMFRSMGIEYGPSHQGVERLCQGTGQALAELALPIDPASSSGTNAYVLHPGLMDAALQACIGLDPAGAGASGTPLVPFALEELVLHAACVSRMWVWIRYSQGSKANAPVLKFDLDMSDEQGNVLVQLKGLTVRALDLQSLAVTRTPSPVTLLLHKEWDQAAADGELPAADRDVNRIVLLGGQELCEPAELQSKLHGVDCIALHNDSASAAAHFRDAAVELLGFLQGIHRSSSENGPLIQLAVSSHGENRLYAGLFGMLRTMRLENPTIAVQLIEFESGEPSDSIVRKLEQDSTDSLHDHIRYEAGQRFVAIRREAIEESREQPSPMPWKDGGVYLITGGAGGLGLIISGEIIRSVNQAVVVLTGRSDLNEAKETELRELRGNGARIRYEKTDVTDRAAVYRLMESIRTEHGELSGIIHSAGLTRDRMLIRKTAEELQEVLAPKVDGLVYLDEASKDMPLDFVIAFSSAAGSLGNPGQADYSAANAFMDAYAQYRNELYRSGLRNGRMLSVGWPLWEEGGMRPDAKTEEMLLGSKGLIPLRTESGMQALYRAWSSQKDHVLVLEGNPPRLREEYVDGSPIGSDRFVHSNSEPHSGTAITEEQEALRSNTVRYLIKLLSEVTKLPMNRIDAETSLEEYGMDSIVAMQLTGEMEKTFGTMPKTLLFEYRNLKELAEYLIRSYEHKLLARFGTPNNQQAAKEKRDPSPPNVLVSRSRANSRFTRRGNLSHEVEETRPSAPQTDIAVIGLSGRYPGARGMDEFWQVLKQGKDGITEIPKSRWDDSRRRNGNEGGGARRWGGFIDGVDEFDPQFFNISPREAETMDPQERLFLERVYEAMEDAGYVRGLSGACGSHHTSSVGVYVGVMYEEYQLYGVREQLQGRSVALSGNSASIANRVSYYCNFHGPSMAVATMCSSSLTAIHLACQSLRQGECELAVAGGVNVSVHPNKYILLEQGQFVSSKGRCESFGLGGDGYVPGEGVGAVLLKPLHKAVADGDPIYGVIKGTAVNHGGKVNGYTVPNPNAQAEVIGKALREAGVDARTVSYVEAHGTGTSLGDPIEIAGLAKGFETYTQDKQFCAIGSVKSNIGHSESAAGIAGLTKVLLQLRYGQLVPSLHAEELNPNIDFAQTPFAVQRELTEWNRPVLNLDGETKAYPRTAGLSSFGAGGSNAHIVIQEYVPSEPAISKGMQDRPAVYPARPALLLLSARTDERLREQAQRLLEAIRNESYTDADLPNIAYTLQVGREAMEERLALQADTMADAVRILNAYVEEHADLQSFHRDGVKRNKEMLTLIAQDEDMAAAVGNWIAKGKYDKLLELWVKGYAIDWSRLYSDAGTVPKRMRLPSYPFARERYWIASEQHDGGTANHDAKTDYLHPLLHANTSDMAEQRYTSAFTGAEFFLADHAVGGQSLLPAAAFLEMARAAVSDAAACLTEGPSAIRLTDVTWLRPLTAGTQSAQVHIGLTPGEGEEIYFDIYGNEEEGPVILYSSGCAELYAAEEAPVLDLDALYDHGRLQSFDAAGVYDSFRLLGIEYGPGHQGIERLSVGGGQVLAELSLPDFLAETEDRYVLHPSLLDSALQASIGLRLAEADIGRDASGLYLPFALDELEVTGTCSSRMMAYVRYSEGSSIGGSVEKFDLDLCDRQGKVCARLRGFTVRKAEAAGIGQHQGEARPLAAKPQMETLRLLPVWNTVKPERKLGAAADSAGGILVIGSAGELREQMLRHWADASSLELAHGDTEDVIALRLEAIGPVRHIIWIAPEDPIESAADEAWIEEQERGVLQVFRLIKALQLLEYGRLTLEWTLVTVEALQIYSHDRLRTAHASVHGLAGAIAKEYPSWRIRVADLEADKETPLSSLFELPSDPQGNSWVYRTGEWHTQKLVPIREAASEPTLCRPGGVYVVIGGAGGIGQVWSEYMIRTYQAKIIWIGRREKDAGIQAHIDRLAAAGTAPEYIAADATDVQSLQRAYLAIKQRHARINGVVHAALVLLDQSLANMDEERFEAALSAKVDVSVRIGQVFRNEPLDFVLFFSSVNAFARSAGQSNYSAGCAFKDAYAGYLAGAWPCAVKVMNWGYWGSTGAVASPEYRERMAQRGIGSIEPPEAMEALEELLAGPANQMALIRTANPGLSGIIDIQQAVSVYPAPEFSSRDAVIFNLMLDDKRELRNRKAKALGDPAASEIERLIARLLLMRLRTIISGAEHGVQDKAMFAKWMEASVTLLAKHWGATDPLNDMPWESEDALWQEWDERKKDWLNAEGLKARVVLAETMLHGLPDIVSGRRPATDVMFPNSSMSLVEGIYKHNSHADYFNEVLADTAYAYLEQRIRHNPAAKVRILEIGAGTGGTSCEVLRKLQPYRDSIQEYAYTDLSRAFLLHAEKEYGPQYPFLTYDIFNAEQGIQEQGIAAGSYDVVIAANVLHATRDIRTVLRNAKALLRSGGILLLNEITRSDLFTHITFGLLDGWWTYEDEALRVAGCPALAPDTWHAVLAEEGFERIIFPASSAHEWGQQIVAAHSDGIARQVVKTAPAARAEDRREAKAQAAAASASYRPEAAESPRAAAVPQEKELLRERSRNYFKGLIGEVLKLPSHRIDTSEPLESYGIDSILVVQLTDALRGTLDSVTSTLFFEHRTIDSLVEHFIRTQEEKLRKLVGMENVKAGATAASEGSTSGFSLPAQTHRPRKPAGRNKGRFVSRSAMSELQHSSSITDVPKPYGRDVAVIGLSGRFPMGGGTDELWDKVKEGRSCISEIPEERWDWRKFYDEEKGKNGSMYTRWGGFIPDIDAFDPMFFRISPKEAVQMDPQERLFLETAYASIEDAGYTPASLSGSRKVGVFVGVMNGNYPTGASYWSIANRVSYLMNFQGPSMAIDTACSSSLTAVHLALESLYSGMSECAVVGGVNLIVDPVHYLKLSAATMLSAGETCRAFGAQADGFVDGETVCSVVLKPLEAAIADGDHIYGVLKGSALTAGGKTNGYTVPNPDAQHAAVAEALRRSGVPARTISYVEAHGTGTALGDPIEIAGLTKAYELETSDKQFCAIGSVKSNIGHAESASGMAGLAKVLLQLKHRMIAPTLHARELNPNIVFAETPFVVQQEAAEWKRPLVEIGGIRKEYPRRAGISSFGAGGANAHLIVEEFIAEGRIDERTEAAVHQPALVVLSARNGDRLKERASRLLAALEKNGYTDADLANIAFTLQVGREEMEERLAFTAGSIEELKQRLGSYLKEEGYQPDLYLGQVKANKDVLAALTADDDMQETMANWIRRGKYGKLLDLWVKGLKVDWNGLYDGLSVKPRRLSLPTYPFARERYWMAGSPFPSATSLDVDGQKVSRDGLLDPIPVGSAMPHAHDEPMTFEEVWQEETLAPASAERVPPRTVACLLSNPRNQKALSDAMKSVWPSARLVFISEQADSGQRLGMDRYDVQGGGRSSLEEAFRDIAGKYGSADAVLYLWPLENPSHIHDPAALIDTIQAIASSKSDTRTLVAAAAFENELDRCYAESWIGIQRSLRNVLPNTAMTVLLSAAGLHDKEPDMREWAERIGAELRASNLRNVLYTEGQRRICMVRPTSDATSVRPVWKAGGTYLITGGCGGLGYLLAEHAARTHRVQLVLTGRSVMDDGIRKKIDSLEAMGSRVEYVQADLCDLPRMREGLARAKARFGPINGAVHAAGIQVNRSVLEKDAEEFRRVLRPKTEGTVALDELLREEPLDFFSLFSSSSAVLGDFGSCDYAAGNRFQMAFANYRNALREQGLRHGHTAALGWPLWRDGGMGFAEEEQSGMYLKASGQRFLEIGEGLALFDRLMVQPGERHLVLAGDRGRIERFLGLTDSAAAAAHPVPAPVELVCSVNGPQAVGGEIDAEKCLERDIKEHIESLLNIPPNKLDIEENLVDFGFDSISLTQFASLLSKQYGIDIGPSLFYGYPTIEKLIGYFMSSHAETIQAYYGRAEEAASQVQEVQVQAQVSPVPVSKPEQPLTGGYSVSAGVPELSVHPSERAAVAAFAPEPIAIIGMSGQFPGANDIEAFWRNLESGESAISEIPPERWDWRNYDGDPQKDPRASSSRWGGFVSDIDRFDPLFFEISPKEAELMDPQQRLFLEEAWHALEDAGYMGERIRGTMCGVYVGAEESQYADVTGGAGQISSNQNATLSARIAYKLDLKGPNFTLTASCSSGLVAVHQACQALRSGDCDMAVAGGVSLTVSPRMYAGLSKANMLSPDGTCSVFDRRANGLVPGEAVAIVVLKPLSKAIADNDRIYGTITASGVNYDGQTNGISAPSPLSQEQLIKQIYERNGIRPERIGFLMAHSVGAKIGDSIEIGALSHAFQSFTDAKAHCAIGSVKPLIGHTFAASGVVSLIAMLMAMKHKTILPLPGFGSLSELINLRNSPFHIANERQEWRASAGGPRLGAISTTGISGTNAHAVIEEFIPPSVGRNTEDHDQVSHAIVLSAHNAERLQAAARQLADYLQDNRTAGVTLRDLAYTLSVGREAMKARLAIVTASREQLITQLEAYLADSPDGLLRESAVYAEHAAAASEGNAGLTLSASEAAESVATALEKRDLMRLASMWAEGGRVPWAKLFVAGSASIVSLPGYPFKKRKCWPKADLTDSVPKAAKTADRLRPSKADEGNKAAELYSFNAADRTTDFEEEYLTFCPFESRIPGFSMSRVMLNPDQYPEEAALVKAKQVELRQVLFYKTDFRRLRSVLDIGCGHGTDVIQIASLYPGIRTHGYTISEGQAELGNKRIEGMYLSSRAEIFHRDSSVDKFPSRYDLVIGIEVCCHIPDKAAVFSNIAGSLQDDGQIVLMDFIANLRGPIVDSDIGIAIATSPEWAGVLSRCGLAIEEIVDVSSWIANYLYDPECERNTEHLVPVARDSLRSYANNAVSLERGWTSYCLFRIRKNKLLSESELKAHNERKLANKTPYAEALEEMKRLGQIPYPPSVGSAIGETLPTL
ncbi:SDR family NAD(P)-dependent oxidoreductase [Paenibacillus kobensis]|uniref:SDR family NAD(P)-dependent oxidoreductase n=1 Tax=Paenibacillus kobensis TaxID=59841 RepID=UPI000FDB18E8|nr:SDR family NAD(P)-dependent oxidoreductase [Paenibacillus kobensis]